MIASYRLTNFASTYGSSSYDTNNYNGTNTTGTGTDTGTGTGASGTGTGSGASGSLSDTGVMIGMIVGVAAATLLAAMIVRIWRRPTRKTVTVEAESSDDTIR